jgi:hypothetical protein
VVTTEEGWACVGVDKVVLELIWFVSFEELNTPFREVECETCATVSVNEVSDTLDTTHLGDFGSLRLLRADMYAASSIFRLQHTMDGRSPVL